MQGDVASAGDRQRLMAEAVAAYGRIDLLVNNAGSGPAVRTGFLDTGEESFDRICSVNLKDPFFLTHLVARQMREQAPDAAGLRGRIVTSTSISAYTVTIDRSEYCIAKAGLLTMTKLLAARLAADGINIFEIRPGIIATGMTSGVKEKYDKLIHEQGIAPLHRWGSPDDIGRAVRAVAEDCFPYSTEAVFDVDGGFHRRRP